MTGLRSCEGRARSEFAVALALIYLRPRGLAEEPRAASPHAHQPVASAFIPAI